MAQRTEEFIAIALEAFNSANNDVDKFELHLRRKVMTIPDVQNVPTPTYNLDSIVENFDFTDPVFNHLENVDVNNLTDEQILDLAKKIGLMTTDE